MGVLSSQEVHSIATYYLRSEACIKKPCLEDLYFVVLFDSLPHKEKVAHAYQSREIVASEYYSLKVSIHIKNSRGVSGTTQERSRSFQGVTRVFLNVVVVFGSVPSNFRSTPGIFKEF